MPAWAERLLCVVETDTPKATSQQARTVSVFKVSCVWVCVGEYYTLFQLMRHWTDTQSWAKQLRVSHSPTHRGQTLKTRHLLLSELYMCGTPRKQTGAFNQERHKTTWIICCNHMLCVKDQKTFINGPGAVTQCHPARSQKPPSAPARLEMLKNKRWEENQGEEDRMRPFTCTLVYECAS